LRGAWQDAFISILGDWANYSSWKALLFLLSYNRLLPPSQARCERKIWKNLPSVYFGGVWGWDTTAAGDWSRFFMAGQPRVVFCYGMERTKMLENGWKTGSCPHWAG
jgi:hypothetical protein